MGFYAPAQIVRDARLHGVEIRPVSINESEWDCTLEPATSPVKVGEGPTTPPAMVGEGPTATPSPRPPAVPASPQPVYAVRLGLRMTKGLSELHAQEILQNRGAGYRSIDDLWRRVRT